MRQKRGSLGVLQRYGVEVLMDLSFMRNAVERQKVGNGVADD